MQTKLRYANLDQRGEDHSFVGSCNPLSERDHHHATSQTNDLPGANHDARRPGSRIPSNSILFTKLVPLALMLMAVLTAALILSALGLLLGILSFR